MKNMDINAVLISIRAIFSGDYFKLASVAYFFYLCQIFWMFCCFPFLLPETQAHNCYVMELSKCIYVKGCVLQQLTS
jgi:hypothetical protein